MSLDRMAQLREYRDLEKRRSKPGLTPLEFLRWLDLREQLPRAAESDPAARATCLLAEFSSFRSLGRAWMTAFAGGGLFIATPFVAHVGSEFTLAVLIKESGDRFEVPCVVASHNLSQGFSTRDMGMGVRFRPRDAQQQARVDAMRTAAGVPAPA